MSAFKPRILSDEQLQAVKLFGVRAVYKNGVRMTEPAHGQKAVRSLLQVGFIQDDEVMDRLFGEVGLSGPGLELFRKNKVITRAPGVQDGTLDVQNRIPGLSDENLSEYADTEQEFGGGVPQVEVIDDRFVVYKLNSIFTDSTLTDKLQLSSRRLQTARRLAVHDPAASASSLGEYIRSNGFPNAKVVSGDYAKTTGRAKEFIRQIARTVSYKDAGAPSLVTPSHLHMTFDGFELATPMWTVIGPLKHAVEVQAVYQLSITYGPEHVLFMFAVETVMLDINIYDERTHEYYTGILQGYSSLAGIRPGDASLPAELTADQQSRLLHAAKKVHPVVVEGAVVGTAVQVTDRHLILNEHTLTGAADVDKVPYLMGLPVYESRSVATDISMVKRQGQTAEWNLRQADVDERVVLCYSVGESVEYSEVLRVLAVSGGQLILSDSNILRKGASGAAVVSLRDFALLGIFSTKRAYKVVCSAFSSSAFSVVTDFESVVSTSEYARTPSEGVGVQTYERMIRKGLQGFLEGIERSTTALYVDHAEQTREAVGTVVNVDGVWITTVCPDNAQLKLADGFLLRFKPHGRYQYAAVAPPPILSGVPNIRAVEPGERVFVFAKSGTDVVMTSVRTVVHVMSDGRFVVEDFGSSDENLLGGLIVAERDAAVLGQLSSVDCDAFGLVTVMCQSLSELKVVLTVTPSGEVPVTQLVTEVRESFSMSVNEMDQLARLGVSVIEMAGCQMAYRKSLSLRGGAVTMIEFWSMNYDAIMNGLGWSPTDWLLFQDQDRRVVADVFAAFWCLRDPSGFSQKIVSFLTDEPVSAVTPSLGSFPFPRAFQRPLSTGSASSLGSRAGLEESTLAGARLRELEDKFNQLSKSLAR